MSSSPARLWKYYQTLSDDECLHALRSASPHGFEMQISSRGMLREILSQYTGTSPARLRIEHGRSGKPYLCPSENPDNLRFSLSHAGDLALYALTWGTEVGVDIEQVTPEHAGADRWSGVLTPAEHESLLRMPLEGQPAAYARIWTKKQAVLKATSRGRAYPMSRLDTTLAPSNALGVIELDGLWNVLDVPVPEPGYAASVATRIHNPLIQTCAA